MSEQKRVAILEDLAPECIAALEEAGLAADVVPEWDEAELERGIAGYDALIVGPSARVTAAALRAGRTLRVVGTTGVAVDAIDVDEATRRGVVVVNAPDSDVVSAAEHTVALLLACARGLAGADADLRAGGWQPRRWSDAGVEVRGKTLGLVGFDRASPAVAETARALGMRVLAWSPVEPGEAAERPFEMAERVDAGRLWAESDFVVVRAAAAAGLGHVVGAAELAAMKVGVRVVDLAGPGGVDPAAFAGALGGGRVAAAAVGVAAAGAPASRALAGAPNVLLAPLFAASTADARLRAGTMVDRDRWSPSCVASCRRRGQRAGGGRRRRRRGDAVHGALRPARPPAGAARRRSARGGGDHLRRQHGVLRHPPPDSRCALGSAVPARRGTGELTSMPSSSPTSSG